MDYPLNVQTAQKALGEVIRTPVKVSIGDIMSVVSLYYELSNDDIVGRRRTRDIAMARQVVMYLARELTPMSLPQIGQTLGGRDHTTVMHGYDKIAALFEKDDNLRRQLLEIKGKLYGHSQRAPWQNQPQGISTQ
jgi:chromosomal replication initiator protein